MDTYGLYPKFSLNRSLNERELAGRLDQHTRLDYADEVLFADRKVIAMNSNYLELVDKFYSSRGFLGFLTFSCSVLISGVYLWMITSLLLSGNYVKEAILALCFIGILAIPTVICLLYILKTEWFAWTHYPLRFDRKHQQVYFHRTDGSVQSVPWQSLFFTTGLEYRKRLGHAYYVSGHILADDGVTVIDSFCLPAAYNGFDEITRHWEFVRRYMAEGPERLLPQVEFCLPIADKKESYHFSLFYLMSIWWGLPSILLPLIAPIALFFSVPRYIGILTCRRPVWPAEIEALCAIDPKDPYRIDASMNPPSLWRAFWQKMPFFI